MPRKKTYSFRPDADLEERLLKGLAATHAKTQDIIEACVVECLDAVVQRMIDKRRQAEAAYLSEKAPPYRVNSPPKRKAG